MLFTIELGTFACHKVKKSQYKNLAKAKANITRSVTSEVKIKNV